MLLADCQKETSVDEFKADSPRKDIINMLILRERLLLKNIRLEGGIA